MKNIKRKVCSVICIMLCSALLLLGAGCGEKTAALLRFNMPEQFDQYKTSCVAENNRYSLIWDAKEKRVVLYDRIKDCEWSYVPYESLNSSYNEEGDEATVHPRVKSPIIVNYYATSTLIDNETNAAAQSIRVSSAKNAVVGNLPAHRCTAAISAAGSLKILPIRPNSALSAATALTIRINNKTITPGNPRG